MDWRNTFGAFPTRPLSTKGPRLGIYRSIPPVRTPQLLLRDELMVWWQLPVDVYNCPYEHWPRFLEARFPELVQPAGRMEQVKAGLLWLHTQSGVHAAKIVAVFQYETTLLQYMPNKLECQQLVGLIRQHVG